MTTFTVVVDLQQAQEQFPELIERVAQGQEVIIVKGEVPFIKMTSAIPTKRQPRRPGTARGFIHIADDFDEPLEDFEEYME